MNIIEISAGNSHTLALTSDGKLFSWGYGNDGQLGLGNLNNHAIPMMINDISVKFSGVYVCSWYSVARSSTGDLYTWGYSPDGLIGHKYLHKLFETSKMEHLKHLNVVFTYIGFYSNLNLCPRRVEWLHNVGLTVNSLTTGQNGILIVCRSEVNG